MGDIEELGHRAQQFYGMGRFLEAEAACREILVRQPGNDAAIHLMAVIACRERRFEEGYGLFQTAITAKPNSIEYRLNYAIALNEGERWSAAEPLLRDLLSVVPDHPLALNNFANAVQMQGRPAEAIEYYRRTLQIAPEMIDARSIWRLLGERYRVSKKPGRKSILP